MGTYTDPMSGQPVQTQLVIHPGNRFTQLSYNKWTGFALRVWGSFTVMPDGRALRTQVEGYEPTQICGPTGECVPITIPMAETVPVQVIDQYRIQMGYAYLQRTG